MKTKPKGNQNKPNTNKLGPPARGGGILQMPPGKGRTTPSPEVMPNGKVRVPSMGRFDPNASVNDPNPGPGTVYGPTQFQRAGIGGRDGEGPAPPVDPRSNLFPSNIKIDDPSIMRNFGQGGAYMGPDLNPRFTPNPGAVNPVYPGPSGGIYNKPNGRPPVSGGAAVGQPGNLNDMYNASLKNMPAGQGAGLQQLDGPGDAGGMGGVHGTTDDPNYDRRYTGPQAFTGDGPNWRPGDVWGGAAWQSVPDVGRQDLQSYLGILMGNPQGGAPTGAMPVNPGIGKLPAPGVSTMPTPAGSDPMAQPKPMPMPGQATPAPQNPAGNAGATPGANAGGAPVPNVALQAQLARLRKNNPYAYQGE